MQSTSTGSKRACTQSLCGKNIGAARTSNAPWGVLVRSLAQASLPPVLSTAFVGHDITSPRGVEKEGKERACVSASARLAWLLRFARVRACVRAPAQEELLFLRRSAPDPWLFRCCPQTSQLATDTWEDLERGRVLLGKNVELLRKASSTQFGAYEQKG